MNNRKAQSALEYLMTYGWAILIIVIVGGALYALNVFTPTTTKVCSGFGTLVYKDHKMTAAGDFTTSLAAPAVGGQVTVTDISCPTSAGGTATNSTPNDVLGSTAGTLFSVGGCKTGTVGTQYSGLTITVTYTSAEGITHSDSAICMGQYE